MTLFKAKDDASFEGPHQSQQVESGGRDAREAEAAMIMIHGRGASAQSILELFNEIETDRKFTLRAPQASGHTWYPYSFLAPTEKNEPGLSSGLQQIHNIIMDLKDQGFGYSDIYLLGFSQGACLASEYVARHPQTYGGLIALSGGLIGDSVDPDKYSGNLNGMPYFVGCSDTDPHIPEERVHESAQVLEQLGAEVTKKLYPGMGHLVNYDEIKHINAMLNS